jgi:NAD(P)-dependent dehydrogenase (short-subunit alcohol dehydrogenase family)
MTTLAGKTLLISGASRGIGLAIALRAAADGANIVLLAKESRTSRRTGSPKATTPAWTGTSSWKAPLPHRFG